MNSVIVSHDDGYLVANIKMYNPLKVTIANADSFFHFRFSINKTEITALRDFFNRCLDESKE